MNKKNDNLLIIISLVLSFGFCLLATYPQFRGWFRDLFLTSNRVILAKADGHLTKDMPVTVVKVKTADTLSLEIYTRNPDSDALTFLKRVLLKEKRDAHFTFRDNATNLVLTDLDEDGNLEILAPTFDENLIPRLNVYRYNPDTHSFSKMGADTIKL